MISKISQGGHTLYNLMEYVLDYSSDVDNLPVDVAAGSTAFVIETSKHYMINSKGEWVEIQ